jgi:hypothetical protein
LKVNVNISTDGKTKAIAVYLNRAKQDFKDFNLESQKDENFTPDEKKYLDHIYKALAAHCENSLEELNLISLDGGLEMKDDKRLQKINTLFEDAIGKYAFTQSFTKNSRLLSSQREKESTEIRKGVKINGL